jgi:hypothetical protein
MQPWLDFVLLTLALSAGWLGWVVLRLAGWSPWRPARQAAGRSPRQLRRGLVPRRDP